MFILYMHKQLICYLYMFLVSQDTLKIATGCQDGLVRVYNTCTPQEAPLELKISPSRIEESITKIAWMDQHLLLAGKRSGTVELWDIRADPSSGIINHCMCSQQFQYSSIIQFSLIWYMMYTYYYILYYFSMLIVARIFIGAVATVEVSKGMTIQDLEINKGHNAIVVACNTKVQYI